MFDSNPFRLTDSPLVFFCHSETLHFVQCVSHVHLKRNQKEGISLHFLNNTMKSKNERKETNRSFLYCYFSFNLILAYNFWIISSFQRLLCIYICCVCDNNNSYDWHTERAVCRAAAFSFRFVTFYERTKERTSNENEIIAEQMEFSAKNIWVENVGKSCSTVCFHKLINIIFNCIDYIGIRCE